MQDKGYSVRSSVKLSVDPKLAIMGYAKAERNGHVIVISEWALDSEMLGGLVLHELAHIYFTEQGAHSHDGVTLERILGGMKEREGLRNREVECLVDSFNHLQNILVDDVVFDVMDEREREAANRFFSEWVSDRPSGEPIADATAACRNAFAEASLRRRNLWDPQSEMSYRNKEFLSALKGQAENEYDWIENFLERATPMWGKKKYSKAIREYFDRVLSLMRSSASMYDMR
jgi:hypothetical protein